MSKKERIKAKLDLLKVLIVANFSLSWNRL